MEDASLEKGARRSSRSSALDADEEHMVQQCQGNTCSSNTPYKRYALIQKKTVVAADGTSSHLLKHTSFWNKIHKDKFEDFYQIKNLIVIFYFGCCCSPSFLLSFFSIVCILVCALLDSNALVGTPCCNIAPCGSPCIFERCVHWVVVCCTTNKKWREKRLLLWWVQ